MLVREVMTREPVTVRPETHVKQALRLLDTHSITMVPVITADSVIVGVLSEADAIRGRVLPDVRGSMLPPDTSHTDDALETVGAVMTQRVVTVTADADVAEAADLMLSSGVKSLPVLDEEHRMVGIVSRRDIVRALARADRDVERELGELFRDLGTSWMATADEGAVTITGPVGDKERSPALAAASTVPGIVHVRIE